MNLNLKQLFKLGQSEVLGLDIGSSVVKMLQMRKDNGSFTVTAAAIAQIADDPDNNKKNTETNTVQAISDCLQSTQIQTRFAVCSVCGPEVAIRHFKFPPLPTEEIPGAVMLEAAQVCPFNVENGGVDYQVILNDADNVGGVLAATTKKMIESKRRLIEEAALNNVLMDVDGLALLNCFSSLPCCKESQDSLSEKSEESGTGQATAILNVGSSFTNLAIIGDNGLPFIRDISYAGNDIIKQVAEENEVATDIVKSILLNTSNTTEPQLGLGGSLKKACRKLIDDVSDSLRYYTAQEKSSPVKKVFVCGGFAMVEGFVQLLDEQLPVAAVLWNPFEQVKCDGPSQCEDILRKNGPAMAVAAGLAMREI
ncbi:MAG: type IV pilus assembly protein PilM [Planctomycetota bacterium]|jgi:type IV pilus assembly protein PilM